ncbi:hypothetical protein Pelo_17273 [Pelomyxa schiedti]|nr:hypothetical protein Pelo_17273 [Pelomyxa schiedti]
MRRAAFDDSDASVLIAADVGDVGWLRAKLGSADCDVAATVNRAYRHSRFNKLVTPLHVACRSGHLGTAAYLIERGASLEGRDVENWTALYYAANSGHTNIVKMLIERGANANIQDNLFHRSPLDVAKYKQFEDLVDLLAPPGTPRGNYIPRAAQDIEKEGNKPVIQGIHFNLHSDLFLGRYRLSPQDVSTVTVFRKSLSAPDITVPDAMDELISAKVSMSRMTAVTYSSALSLSALQNTF